MTRVQPVRIGLVGYGKGGRFFHAPLAYDDLAQPVDPWDAVACLEVLEAAQHSAVTGQVITLNPGASVGSGRRRS